MFRFGHAEPVAHRNPGLMAEAEYRVSVEMPDGSRLVRVAATSDDGRLTSPRSRSSGFRTSENGNLVILVDDEVVEAFARGAWSRVVREWVHLNPLP